jgi:D-alanyl-D-alanine dipeptidase
LATQLDRFLETPIILPVLPHTGRIDGDDYGYRKVPVSTFDAENPDPLVNIAEAGIICQPIYHVGSVEGICPYYQGGIEGDLTMLLRMPAANAVNEVDRILRSYGRRLIALDAFRRVDVQANLWKYQFGLASNGAPIDGMSIEDIVHYGYAADDIGSYGPTKVTDLSSDEVTTLVSDYRDLFAWLAHQYKESQGLRTPEDAAAIYLTFLCNLGRCPDIELDPTQNTAHGSGGALDAFLLDISTGKPTCLGVPFDCPGEATAMRFFEDENNLGRYKEIISDRADIRQYLAECGITEMTSEVFRDIRNERRLLFHAMSAVGATTYHGECWHFNFGNLLGGNQANVLPNAGNSCHSLLRNVRHIDEITAIWGGAAAHKMAAEMLSPAV